jgi:hypothetical protein
MKPIERAALGGFISSLPLLGLLAVGGIKPVGFVPLGVWSLLCLVVLTRWMWRLACR